MTMNPYQPRHGPERTGASAYYAAQEDVDTLDGQQVELFARIAVLERAMEAMIDDITYIGQVLFEEPVQEEVDEALNEQLLIKAMIDFRNRQEAVDTLTEDEAIAEENREFEESERDDAALFTDKDEVDIEGLVPDGTAREQVIARKQRDDAEARAQAADDFAAFERENESPELAATDMNDVVDVPEEGNDV